MKRKLPKRGESDDNFDGQIETEFFYKNGLIDRVAIDTNLNLEPEIIEYYTNDVLDEKIWIPGNQYNRILAKHTKKS